MMKEIETLSLSQIAELGARLLICIDQFHKTGSPSRFHIEQFKDFLKELIDRGLLKKNQTGSEYVVRTAENSLPLLLDDENKEILFQNIGFAFACYETLKSRGRNVALLQILL